MDLPGLNIHGVHAQNCQEGTHDFIEENHHFSILILRHEYLKIIYWMAQPALDRQMSVVVCLSSAVSKTADIMTQCFILVWKMGSATTTTTTNNNTNVVVFIHFCRSPLIEHEGCPPTTIVVF